MAGLEPTGPPGALCAAGHTNVGILLLLAMYDRWDIDGLSTAMHPQTGASMVSVYDGYAGGTGLAERNYWVEHD